MSSKDEELTELSEKLQQLDDLWITHPAGTRGFNHLFNAALAEFELHLASLQYLGKANELPSLIIFSAAQSEAPTKGSCLELEAVFSLRHGCSINSI